MEIRNIISLLTIGIIVSVNLGITTAAQTKASLYKKPIGGFLLPHPEFEQQHDIPLPHHFENLRVTRSIKDPKQRQILLDETLVRVKRSPEPDPQFLPNVRGRVGTGGLNLNVATPIPPPGLPVVQGNAGLNVGGGIGDGRIGAGISAKVDEDSDDKSQETPKAKAGFSLGGSGVGGKLSGGLGSAIPKVGGKVPVGGIGAGAEAGINTGLGAGASINTGAIGVPKHEGDLNIGGDASLGGGVSLPSLPDVKGEVGLGGIGGSINANAGIPNIGGELNTDFGGIGADTGINTNLNIPKVEGELGFPNLSGNVDIGATLPTIPKFGGEVNANLGGIGGGINTDLNIPKLEGEVGIPKLGGKIDLGASIPKVPTGKAEIAIPNIGLNVLGQRQRGEKAASIRPDDSYSNSLTSPSPFDAPSSLSESSSSQPESKESDKEEEKENPTTTTEAQTMPSDDGVPATTLPDSEPTTTITEAPTTIKPILTTTTEMPMNSSVKGGELYLPADYNVLEIPRPNYGKLYGQNIPGPLPCLVFLNILGVGDFNELEEVIAFDADLTVEWIDANVFDITKLFTQKRTKETAEKIKKSSKTLAPTFLKKIWRPDLYFENLIKVEQPTVTNKAVLSLKYNEYTGFISYTVRYVSLQRCKELPQLSNINRMTVHVQCPMSFEYYPADTQVCEFRIGSYSHGNEEMQLRWLILGNKKGVNLQDPSENNFDLKLADVEEEKYRAPFNNPLNETHDILTFSISGRRKISYHLLQTYLPSIFHIFITWLVFLIPYSLYDARIGTTMTTLLTLTAMFSAVRETAPVVSYIKAIDLWMLACVFFVFLNLVELTLMTWMRVTVDTLQEVLENIEEDEETGDANNEKRKRKKSNSSIDSDSVDMGKQEKRIKQFRKVYRTFEKYSFYTFAAMFIIFNIIYWIWLMTASEYLAWTPGEEQEL